MLGHLARTPLEILYSEWKEERYAKLVVNRLFNKICDKLDVLRDDAAANTQASNKRKDSCNKGKTEEIGRLVLTRIPGLSSELEEEMVNKNAPYQLSLLNENK